MTVLLYIAAAIALDAVILETGFFALATAERIEAQGIPITGYRRWIVYLWLLLGWPADVLYNWSVGSIVFREFPRELTYSSRVGRLARAGNARALAEARFLNAATAPLVHIKL